jgi:hypothetical protein
MNCSIVSFFPMGKLSISRGAQGVDFGFFCGLESGPKVPEERLSRGLLFNGRSQCMGTGIEHTNEADPEFRMGLPVFKKIKIKRTKQSFQGQFAHLIGGGAPGMDDHGMGLKPD